jgi:hypothetical protein
MSRLLPVVATLALAVPPALSAPEQEAVEQLADTIRAASELTQRAKAIEQFQMETALQIAAEERDLNMLFAQKALSADIAVATAIAIASTAEPSQVRREYQDALNQAINDYRQGLSEVQNDWSNNWSTASNRIHREASDAFQQIYNEMSRAQNRISNALMGQNTDMPMVIEPSLPDMSVDAGPIDDTIAQLQEAAEEARQRYQADIQAAETVCDEALAAALNLAAGAEMDSAMQKPIIQLKVTCLDRHDQYAMEIRSAARRALLPIEE